MATTDQEVSNFDISICDLAEKTNSVPRGWVRPFMSGLVSLFAVRCNARCRIGLSGPYDTDCSLVVRQNGEDLVVAGILRKLAKTTCCTCRHCGQRGKPRIIGESLQVLCAQCAAPRLMRREIDSMLRDQFDNGKAGSFLHSFDDIPMILRPAVPKNSWQVMRGRSELTLHITEDEIRRLRPRFESIRKVLEAHIGERQDSH